jgi:hypothetical protein
LDLQLERMGYTRQVTIKTPSMLSAPFIIEQSDLLLAIPRFAAGKMKLAAQLALFELPLPCRRLR